MKYAPIAIFTYNRLDCLRILINSLKRNILAKNSVVFIFSDRWKYDYDKKEVLSVRKYIGKISGFKKIFIIYRSKNFGLSRNIIDGINFVLKIHNEIIVLEDDLKLSKYFLRYMNDALKIYNNEKKVASISGWSFPIYFKTDSKDYFFIKGADCWGWGTWRRAWKKFNPDGKKLLGEIKNKNLISSFDLNDSFKYTKMLQDNIYKKNDSWAIRWYASAFLKNMYTLYPKISLVQNVGTKNGVHSHFDFLNFGHHRINLNYKPIIKTDVEENELDKIQIINFYKKNYLFKYKELLKKFLFR